MVDRSAGNRRRSARSALRASLVPLAVASGVGYLRWAGALLLYDASGGLGPLAPIGDWPILGLVYGFSYLLLGPIIYAVATWRLNGRGALIALAGVAFVAPLLWWISPWSMVDPMARAGVFDDTRGWIGFGLEFLGIGWFFVVPPLTFLARRGWRKLRSRSVAGPRLD